MGGGGAFFKGLTPFLVFFATAADNPMRGAIFWCVSTAVGVSGCGISVAACRGRFV